MISILVFLLIVENMGCLKKNMTLHPFITRHRDYKYVPVTCGLFFIICFLIFSKNVVLNIKYRIIKM